MAGVTIFAILGNLAFELNVDIKVVAGAGPALAFVSYPDAISKFDYVPQVCVLNSNQASKYIQVQVHTIL